MAQVRAIEAAQGKAKAAKAAKAKAAKAGKLPAADDQSGYTLQLSSFQDRVEAERFMNSLRQKGHDPQMVPTRIPNRGLWYRVRLGSYGSWQKALSAKRNFETSTKLIAYVARR
jgi:DedD protein